MRRINPNRFTTAKQGTSREINRQIALTLIRANQPVSRADLSRLMDTNRASVTFLINDLIKDGLVKEGAVGNDSKRGRRPTFLHLDSKENFVVAVDIRVTRTFIMMTDMLGNQLGDILSFPTEVEPSKLADILSEKIEKLLKKSGNPGNCAGIGVIVPGMIDSASGMILRAPTLGWFNIDLYSLLKKHHQEVPVFIENSGKACALSQIWISRNADNTPSDLVFVSISDGIGVGVIINGELVSGKHNTAGEYGHLPLDIDGPRCSCGANGCWEAYISNLATISRYTENFLSGNHDKAGEIFDFTVEKIIKLARKGDQKALTALQLTAKFIGFGLSTIINTMNPSQIYIAGEITEAWDFLALYVHEGIEQRSLTDELKKTPILIVLSSEYPRLKGAVALVTAPAFAAPRIA